MRLLSHLLPTSSETKWRQRRVKAKSSPLIQIFAAVDYVPLTRTCVEYLPGVFHTGFPYTLV